MRRRPGPRRTPGGVKRTGRRSARGRVTTGGRANAGRPRRRRRRPSHPPALELKHEIEARLQGGSCAYCGMAATPERPLTREHAIPRSRGGGRREWRVIVPACLECNRRRGCQPLARFLFTSPARLARLLDFLASLPIAAACQVDVRVFAEVYAALWLLEWAGGAEAPSERMVHRRRAAARRVLTRLLESSAGRCAARRRGNAGGRVAGAARQRLRILAAVLAAAWGSWQPNIARELARAMDRQSGGRAQRRAA